MDLRNLAIPTAVIHPGARVREFFAECVRRDVPGVPYVDEQGVIVGRLSIRHSFKQSCIPRWVINAAHVLGDGIHAVNIPHVQAKALLDEPVERHLLRGFASSSSHSPIVKGLAIMEQENTSYIFLIDEGVYKGVVTHMAIARRMMESTGTLEL
jgi:hypothetical protein